MRAHAVVTVLLLLVGRGLPAAAQELSAETLQAINSASRARARLGDAEWHRLAATGRGVSAGGAPGYVPDRATPSSRAAGCPRTAPGSMSRTAPPLRR